jgi:hypothetical protein
VLARIGIIALIRKKVGLSVSSRRCWVIISCLGERI